jgi:hypothetical protein
MELTAFRTLDIATPPRTPERELLATMLADAIECAAGRVFDTSMSDRKREQKRAQAWFRGEDALLPFEYVCEQLDLSPSAVRRAMRAAGVCLRRQAYHRVHVAAGRVRRVARAL